MVLQLAFTPDGDLLAAGVGGIRRFDLGTESGSSVWVWKLDPDWYASMSLSRDGRLLLARARLRKGSGGADNPLVFFDLAAGTRRAITTHGNRVEAVALDPSGEMIVTGDAQGAVRVGPADGGEPHLLLGHSVAVNWMNNALAISPDGRWIASAAGDEIRLWPMPDVTKPPLHTLPLDELVAKLHELTNVEVVADEASPGGYKIEIGPFPGWKNVPTWFTPAHEATGEDSR
jgi:WD40 repeat protein